MRWNVCQTAAGLLCHPPVCCLDHSFVCPPLHSQHHPSLKSMKSPHTFAHTSLLHHLTLVHSTQHLPPPTSPQPLQSCLSRRLALAPAHVHAYQQKQQARMQWLTPTPHFKQFKGYLSACPLTQLPRCSHRRQLNIPRMQQRKQAEAPSRESRPRKQSPRNRAKSTGRRFNSRPRISGTSRCGGPGSRGYNSKSVKACANGMHWTEGEVKDFWNNAGIQSQGSGALFE